MSKKVTKPTLVRGASIREPVSRRGFLLSAAAVPMIGATTAQKTLTFAAPSVIIPKVSRPCVVGSDSDIRGVKVAYDMLMKGADTLDAIIAGVNIQELDPEYEGAGLGGRPKENGVVQLDASCMHGPSKRAGAVAALEGFATPSLVAKAVMDYTDHTMLAGHGARQFALAMGFKEQNLLTEPMKQAWLKWRSAGGHKALWINDKAREAWLRWNGATEPSAKPKDPPSNPPPTEYPGEWSHDTVHLSAVGANGDISSCTSTCGTGRIAGGVGDSPIIGAGQYCDNEVGAAGSTGSGEAVMKVCGAFLTVEGMRSGLSPTDSCLETLRRVVATTESRLLDPRGRPKFGLVFYAVNKRGEFGGAIMSDNYPFESYAVADADGVRLVPLAAFYDHTVPMRDTMVRRREIALDSAALDRFVGEYAVRLPIVITKDKGSLWAQPLGNRRVELFAEAPMEFFMKSADIQLSFVVDASGAVTGLVLHMHGLDRTGKKFPYDQKGAKVR